MELLEVRSLNMNRFCPCCGARHLDSCQLAPFLFFFCRRRVGDGILAPGALTTTLVKVSEPGQMCGWNGWVIRRLWKRPMISVACGPPVVVGVSCSSGADLCESEFVFNRAQNNS